MNLSTIRPGQLEDLPEMHRLHSTSLRSYFYDDLGSTEVPDLLKGANAVLVDHQTERLKGFVSFDSVQRSEALPVSAPTKVSLRAVALSSAGATARLQFRALFENARQQLPVQPQGYLFYALTEQRWLQASLKEAGFDQCDAVRFYERKSRAIHPLTQPATLRLAQPADLPPLARLDAAAFDPLWHMGVADLTTLQCDCRFEIAELSTQTVGYSAFRLNPDGSPHGHDSAQLVRLAVHPRAQSLGIGRQLLVASLCYAHQLGIGRVFLNTQESNSPSQKLYESLQFRKRGRAVPVLVKEVSQCLA
jgi:ribosomal protein S18 acetylase RimI-like enzyme